MSASSKLQQQLDWGAELRIFDQETELESDVLSQLVDCVIALEKIRDVEPLTPQARNMAELAREVVRSLERRLP